jgi:hypothetical protein
MTDAHTKIEKKYKSKAAQSYKAVLAKMVEAEAAKRGEGTVEDDASGSLLENLQRADEMEEQALAQAQSAATTQPTTAVAKNLKAAEQPGAKGRLITPPSSGNAPKIVLRKPASTGSINILKKKPSSGKTGLRVNKLPVGGNPVASSNGNSSDDNFEDVDATVKGIEDAKIAETARLQKEQAEQAALAKQLEELQVMENDEPQPPTPPAVAPQQPTLTNAKPPSPLVPVKQSIADSMSRLKAETSDFFGGF